MVSRFLKMASLPVFVPDHRQTAPRGQMDMETEIERVFICFSKCYLGDKTKFLAEIYNSAQKNTQTRLTDYSRLTGVKQHPE